VLSINEIGPTRGFPLRPAHYGEQRSLAGLCLVLTGITLATNVVAQMLVRQVSGVALPVGRGF
jgi:hypothetical protein